MPDNQETPSKELGQKGGDLSDKVQWSVGDYALYDGIRFIPCAIYNQEQVIALVKQLTTTQQALDSAVAALEWQPIETAPKDGTPILVAVKGYIRAQIDYYHMEARKFFNWGDLIIAWMPLPNPALASKE